MDENSDKINKESNNSLNAESEVQDKSVESLKLKKRDLPKWEKEVIIKVYNGIFIQRITKKRKINRRSDAIVEESIIDTLADREILMISEPAVEINTQTRICIIKANEEEIEAYLVKKNTPRQKKPVREVLREDQLLLLQAYNEKVKNASGEVVATFDEVTEQPSAVLDQPDMQTDNIEQPTKCIELPDKTFDIHRDYYYNFVFKLYEILSKPEEKPVEKSFNQTNYIVLDNNPKRRFWGWFAIFLVMLLVSVAIVGYIMTSIAKPPKSPAVFNLKEDGISWVQLEDLNVFANPEYNGEKIIRPGSKGIYDFIIGNENDTTITYWFYMHEINEHKINMKYKLKLEGAYIFGSEDNWVGVLELKHQDLKLLSNSRSLYTLEWYWEEGEQDTDIAKSRAEYRLRMTINAKIEYGK